MNRLSVLTLATALVCNLAWNTARAQAAPAGEPRQQAIHELECRTLLRLSGEERDFTLLYFHGFVSGRVNQQLLPVKDLAEDTDRLIDRCIDKPSDKVLAVLEQLRAARK
ncbi:MAG: HdeA/HdeB family chaperone [Rubrivivax sp.]|nr:HdeA/HdeB family chaperone [Rubrivivax sp.]